MLWILFIVFVVGPFLAATAYMVVTAAKRVRDEGLADQLNWWVKIVIYAWVVVGFPFDVLFNWTYAWIGFKERPREFLLTTRLKRYRMLPEPDPRKKRAVEKWTWLNFFETEHW